MATLATFSYLKANINNICPKDAKKEKLIKKINYYL